MRSVNARNVDFGLGRERLRRSRERDHDNEGHLAEA
jgi:hypothetical protein